MGTNSQTPYRFLQACLRQEVDATPVWFMRQAGRYMAEYRAIREKYTLLEMVRQPQVAAEVTMQPVDRLGVDAAILFADILLPAIPMGINLEFAKGEGPVIHNPVRTQPDVEDLRRVDPETDLGEVMEAVRLVRRQLDDMAPRRHVALIGFSGAPFTLASYMVEGGASRDYRLTKTLMYSEPVVWRGLMEHLSETLAAYLIAQVNAGAQAVQLFDSWVGALSPADYQQYVLPYSQAVIQAVQKTGVPVIHFGTGTTTLLPLMQQAGGDVIGIDWRLPLDQGRQILGMQTAIQGNLDPVALFAPLPVLKDKVHDILQRAGGQPGHIFNLGHGILPGTPVEAVRAVVDMVHAYQQ